ncbi:MAG: hypothetical protein FJX77_06065 [Armatimonadetes bacterium]|nr:hypothetical protein [Armatimonadota bacterium]
MRLWDAGAWLGHYPFRAVPDESVDGLLRTMDRHGIEGAVVANLNGAFYRDAHRANEELARWIAPHRDRLIPWAVLNPTYPGWREDWRECREEWGMGGLRLFPLFHRYSLTAPECLSLVEHVTESSAPLAIPLQLEDRRQRHWMDPTGTVSLTEIAELARACPSAHLLVLAALGVESSPFVQDPSLAGARVGFDFSRMATVLQATLPRLLDAVGPERLFFAAGLPLKTPGPALLKLELLEVSDAARNLLASGNLRRWGA